MSRPAKSNMQKAISDKKLEKKIEELTSDLQRVHADFINFRQRSESEKNEIMNLAKQSVITQLLPLVDNIERALNQVPKEIQDHAWVKGVQQSARQIEAWLKDFGVERIPAVGREFNPHLHEAMSFESGKGKKEIISEEIQSGWKMGEQVMRPSLVKVKKE